MSLMTASFAGTCTACNVRFPAGTPILWQRGRGASHHSTLACDAAKASAASQPQAASPVAVTRPELLTLAAFLTAAKSRGLKFPKARFLANGGGEIRLSLAGVKARVPGAVQVVLNGVWIGRINPDGAVVGRDMTEQVLDMLALIATSPAEAAKAYGMLTSSCSFCGLMLTDAGSIDVGYGPICARKWGLPHTPKGTPGLAPVPGSSLS